MDTLLTYDDLFARLRDAEEMIHSLASQQADAVVSPAGVHLLRLHETDQALRVAMLHLESMLSQRTEELEASNRMLLKEVAERRGAERRLTSVIESAMDAIVTWNEASKVVIFNSAAERILGYSARDALGCPVESFLPGIVQFQREHSRRNGAAGNAARRNCHLPAVLRGVRKDGTEFPIEATFSDVQAAGEQLYTVILRDVSLRKQTEAALIQSEKLASVGRVAAMIAHEINNPLTAIQNILYALQNDMAGPSPATFLTLAETEVRRAIQIAQNTLGLSRPSGAPEAFRIAEAVEGVVLLLDRKLRERGIAIETQCTPHDMEIVAVVGEIKQVLWNLITNAIDAVPSKTGRIQVRVSGSQHANSESGTRITVADNGIGMEPGTIRRMKEPFYTTKSNGTGLGMWVTAEIVERHSGSLQIRSSTDPARHGTVISISLPSGSQVGNAPSESR